MKKKKYELTRKHEGDEQQRNTRFDRKKKKYWIERDFS